MDVNARAEEEQGFENGVGDQVKYTGEEAASSECHDHEAELADGRIGEYFFDVGIDHCNGRCEDCGEGGDAQDDECCVLRRHKERVQTNHEKDACCDHGGRMQQGADRCGAFHGVG